MKTQLEFLSLFTGGGGLDIGFELAGWRCLYASDIDSDSVETLLLNRGRKVRNTGLLDGALIEQADVREISGDDILKKVGRKRGQIPLLIGGPPCQSWSSAGHQLGFEDPRGRLFQDYVRIAVETGVRWIVFENVRGLLTARGRDGQPGSALEHIRQTLLTAGFQTDVELLNAADYGVPQRRVRLCVIGYRVGDRPPFPASTHSKSVERARQRPWVSLGECLAKLKAPQPGEIIRPNEALHAQLSVLRPGTGVKSPGKPETTRPGGHWGYKQGAFLADPTLPARTVTASAQQDWVLDPELGLRRLHPRECAAIQTFPSTWAFAGNRTAQYRQIGNAVPPKLAYAIATALKAHVEATDHSGEQQMRSLVPLGDHLLSAIRYTINDERKNGHSRRAAPTKRRQRAAVGQEG